MNTAPVTSADRLAFTGFIAIVVHAMIILGISFNAETHQAKAQTLEVTLANYRSDEAPQQADFLAQIQQNGSGAGQQRTY